MSDTAGGDAVAAWRECCARLAALGDRLESDAFPHDDRGRAEGVRHLARHVVLALQGELEHASTVDPRWHRYEEPWAQWGGPNPDNVYLRCAIDPTATYRLWGDVRGLRQAIFSLADGDMHLGQYGVFSERTLDMLAVGDDGVLEIVVSPTEQPGNWMPSDPEARILTIRQYQYDWEHDAIATFHIERTDARGTAPAPPASDAVAHALARATHWVEQSLAFWHKYTDAARKRMPANVFGPPGTPPGGAPNIAYGAGWWQLAPNEALLITSEVPDADYWSWTIHTRYWLDSGDFDARQTSVNGAQAYVDDDGLVRLVAAHVDPGVPNWIDLGGRAEGMIVYRSVGARTKPVPEARVVAVADLRAQLPVAHPTIDASARADALARRRIAVRARYV